MIEFQATGMHEKHIVSFPQIGVFIESHLPVWHILAPKHARYFSVSGLYAILEPGQATQFIPDDGVLYTVANVNGSPIFYRSGEKLTEPPPYVDFL